VENAERLKKLKDALQRIASDSPHSLEPKDECWGRSCVCLQEYAAQILKEIQREEIP